MTNDLNGFRASVGNSIAQYDHNIDVLNTGVIRKKVGAAKKAADTLGKGAELLRTGLETEGAIVGGKLIGAAGKQIYGAVSRRLGSAASDVTEKLGSTVQTGTSGVATPIGGNNVNPEFQSGQGTDVNSTEMSDLGGGRRPVSNQFTRDGQDPETGLRTSPQADPATGETKENFSPNEDGYGETKAGDSVETKAGDLGDDLATDAGDVADSAASAAEGAGNVAAGAGDAVASAASGVTDTVASAAAAAGDAASSAVAGAGAAAESALSEVAAATSWIPFIGEIMGGVAAVGGLVTAGIGIYDDVVGGAQQAAAEAMPDKASNLPSVNLAGSYIAPISSSVNV